MIDFIQRQELPWPEACGWAALALVLGFVLALIWRVRGWGDVPCEEERFRKLQLGAVPAVGGLAIAITWGLQSFSAPLTEEFQRPFLWGALAIALFGGMLDDARAKGLTPRTKLCIQFAAGAWLGAAALFPAGLAGGLVSTGSAWWTCFGSAVLATIFANGLNTFDNADGAVGAVVGTGLTGIASPLAPACWGFLIPNLLRRRQESGDGSSRGSADPWVYLGDGGSQMLALAVLATPAAWGVLVLPLADLGHVAFQRIRIGTPPWRGDRRHVAHRLQRRGLGPLRVALVLVLVALPAIGFPGLAGVAVTLILYLAVLVWTRESESRRGPDATLECTSDVNSER